MKSDSPIPPVPMVREHCMTRLVAPSPICSRLRREGILNVVSCIRCSTDRLGRYGVWEDLDTGSAHNAGADCESQVSVVMSPDRTCASDCSCGSM